MEVCLMTLELLVYKKAAPCGARLNTRVEWNNIGIILQTSKFDWYVSNEYWTTNNEICELIVWGMPTMWVTCHFYHNLPCSLANISEMGNHYNGKKNFGYTYIHYLKKCCALSFSLRSVHYCFFAYLSWSVFWFGWTLLEVTVKARCRDSVGLLHVVNSKFLFMYRNRSKLRKKK